MADTSKPIKSGKKAGTLQKKQTLKPVKPLMHM